jgi:hydrogenase maturation protease
VSDPVAPVLVLGWGNLSRGDDALGPLCVAALRDTLPAPARNRVEFLDDYQLQVELALDLVGRTHILFIDASLDCAAPFEVRQAQPRRDSSISSHALSPEALLQVFVDLRGEAPPPATVLAIRGEAFELGEPMTATASAHLAAAVVWAADWLARQ